MNHEPWATDPPTYTIPEVLKIFATRVTERSLKSWDTSGIFRPSQYAIASAPGGLISSEQLDQLRKQRGKKSRGDPHRAYTYDDLVRLSLFLYVKEQLEACKVGNEARRAAKIMEEIRQRTGEECPRGIGVIVIGKKRQWDAYLLDGERAAQPLTGGQLLMTALFTDAASSRVRGRIALLTAQDAIRKLPIVDVEIPLLAKAG